MTAPIRSMPEPYRVCTDYEALVEAVRDRIEDINKPHLEIDAVAQFQTGYTGKIVCGAKNLGLKSLGGILKATGMAIVLVADDERFAPIKAQMKDRKRPMRSAAASIEPKMQVTTISSEQLIKDHMRKIGAKGNMAGAASNGGKRRAKMMKARARQRAASHAARMRWSKRHA